MDPGFVVAFKVWKKRIKAAFETLQGAICCEKSTGIMARFLENKCIYLGKEGRF